MHDWIAWGEQLSDKGWELGTTELMQYSAWSFVPWHFLFANTVNEMPAYPRADYEVGAGEVALASGVCSQTMFHRRS